MHTILPAAPQDAPLIGQLRQQCWAATYRGIYPDHMIDQFDYAHHAKRDLRCIVSPEDRVYLIRADGQPVGYLHLSLNQPPLLRSLYLLPEAQGQGIGRAAFDLVRQTCLDLGREDFHCQCHPDNAPALGFYRHMGGVAVGEDLCPERWQSSVTLRFPARPRCRWCNPANPRYAAYHDQEWGVPCHEDPALFELLILEGFQAGLSWECVLNKRDAFREAFDGFDVQRVMAYDEGKIAALMADPRIIRNGRKIRAAIGNAAVFRAIQEECGSFDAYLRRFTGGDVLIEHGKTRSELSDRLSADLYRRGMRFVGTTIIYAYLQAIGAINSHEPGCFLYPGA